MYHFSFSLSPSPYFFYLSICRSSCESWILGSCLRGSAHLVCINDCRISKQLFYGEISAGKRRPCKPKLMFKDSPEDTLKNTAIFVEDWEKLTCDRPWLESHQSAEEFEFNWIIHQQLKRADGKDEFESINIQKGEVLSCSLSGKLCISRAALVIPLRKHKDIDAKYYQYSCMSTMWQTL